MSLLEIKNLSVQVQGKEILKDFSLTILAGKVYTLMGPNGSGKSTLALVLAGHPHYVVTAGSITYQGVDLLSMKPDARAKAGIFLSFQNPTPIPGVRFSELLFASYKEIYNDTSYVAFKKKISEILLILHLPESFLERYVHDGLSGGEKKKMEMLQLLLLQPTFAILDETDSGLDIDALKVVARGITALKKEHRSILIITHYRRMLEMIEPDYVAIIKDGRIVREGGRELSEEIEENGFN